MNTRAIETDEQLEDAIKLATSSSHAADALKQARAEADAVRREMRAKYGHRKIAVELVQKGRDGE